MNGKVKHVDALPILDQAAMGQFPEFDSEASVLLAFNTEWHNTETEMAACAAITACKSFGEWRALDAKEYLEVLQRYPLFKMNPQVVINGMWNLVEKGAAEIIEFDGRQYIVPQPSLTRVALAKGVQLRIA